MSLLTAPAAEAEAPALAALVAESGLFPPEALPALFAARLRGGPDAPHWRVARLDGAVAGFAYAAPEPFTGGAWTLRALAARAVLRRRGVARALLADMEAALRAAGARLLVVDTADGPALAPARALYRREGYEDGGAIPAFWGPGEAKIVVFKRL